jgi:hypothetical protein
MACDEDRAHFQRVAAAMREEANVRLREELRRPAMERLVEGLVLGEAFASSPVTEALLDQRALAQAELHRRARRLGLIR